MMAPGNAMELLWGPVSLKMRKFWSVTRSNIGEGSIRMMNMLDDLFVAEKLRRWVRCVQRQSRRMIRWW